MKRTIKKYPNRRLYDTEESRYITLEELATSIRGGIDVAIHDASTGADLTAATLTQVLLESRGGAKLLPVPFLLQLVRMQDDALAEFMSKYMSLSMDIYLQAKQGASALGAISPLANVPFAVSNALARLLLTGLSRSEGQKPSPTPASAFDTVLDGAAPAMPQLSQSDPEVQALRRELDAIKKQLKQSPRKRL
jgi:polyhydroxyalkanoate synthesis repressor PhaR